MRFAIQPTVCASALAPFLWILRARPSNKPDARDQNRDNTGRRRNSHKGNLAHLKLRLIWLHELLGLPDLAHKGGVLANVVKHVLMAVDQARAHLIHSSQALHNS